MLNQVELQGKITRVSILRYTPSGVPLLECQIAYSQERFGKHSVGYIAGEAAGDLALEFGSGKLRVGTPIRLKGSLWFRQFRDRNGRRQHEMKVIVTTINLRDS